jgi:O-antigen ligase
VERAAAALLILGVVFSQRIALANILIGLAFLTWLAALVRGSASWRRADMYPALVAWAAAALLSVIFSLDPISGLPALWGLLTMVVVPMSVSLLDRRRWDRMFAGLAAWAVLSSGLGLWQYLHGASGLDNRLHGFVSHYMTFSGWTLMVILLLVADILFNRPERRRWTIPVCALCCITLALTYTRGTWLGCAVGMTFLVGLWRPRAAVLVPVLAVALAVVAPATIRQRALSILDPGHPSNYDRVCMARAGISMVADHPVTGIGLEMIKPSYEDYRVPGSIMDRPPHLHSNPVHIAAERGLLGLAAYLWILAAFAVAVWRGLRGSDGAVSWEVAGAAAAVLGISVSGLFEYYWGDAEVWIVTLACLATPYALSRRDGS